MSQAESDAKGRGHGRGGADAFCDGKTRIECKELTVTSDVGVQKKNSTTQAKLIERVLRSHKLG